MNEYVYYYYGLIIMVVVFLAFAIIRHEKSGGRFHFVYSLTLGFFLLSILSIWSYFTQEMGGYGLFLLVPALFVSGTISVFIRRKSKIVERPSVKGKNQYMGFLQRVAAHLVDVGIISLLLLVTSPLYIDFFRRDFGEVGLSWAESDDTIMNIVGMGYIIYVLYSCIMLYRYEGTIGKRVFGYKVIRSDGQKLHLWNIFLRELSRLVHWFGLGFGYLFPLFNNQKRALHDFAGKSIVVRNK